MLSSFFRRLRTSSRPLPLPLPHRRPPLCVVIRSLDHQSSVAQLTLIRALPQSPQQTASEDVVASERSSLDPHSPELAQQLKPKPTAEDEAHLGATHSEDVVASERSSIDPHSPELAQKIKPSREEHARQTGSEDVVAGERSGADPLEGKPEKVGGEKKGGMFSWLFNGSK